MDVRGMLQSWSQANKDHCVDAAPGLPADSLPGLGFHASPAGCDAEMKLRVVDLVPPGELLAKMLLCGRAGRPQQDEHTRLGATQETLLAAWEKLHQGVKAADLPKIPKRTCTLKVCYFAGFCICHRRFTNLRSVVRNWQKCMRKFLFDKDGDPRKFYDLSALVVYLTPRPAGPGDSAQGAVWAHLSFANLNTMRMTLTSMDEITQGPEARVAEDAGATVLQVPRGYLYGGENMWRFFFKHLDLESEWRVSFYRFVSDNTAIYPFVLSPAQVRWLSLDSHIFWFGKRARRPAGALPPPPPDGGAGDLPGPLPLPAPPGEDSPHSMFDRCYFHFHVALCAIIFHRGKASRF